MQVVFEKEKVKKFRDASEFFRKNSLAYLFFKKRRFYERNLFKNLLKKYIKNLHLHFEKLKKIAYKRNNTFIENFQEFFDI